MSQNDSKKTKKYAISGMDSTPSNLPTQENFLAATIEQLKKNLGSKVVKLAIEEDPDRSHSHAYIYKQRTNLVHPTILKKIRDTEELIGGIIIPLRANQVSLFGKPRPNRFDVGFTINLLPHVYAKYSSQEIEKIKLDVIPKLRDLLLHCGRETGLLARDQLTFSQFLRIIVEDVLTFGWFAVEVRRDSFGNFHSFRPVDAGTIYYAVLNQGSVRNKEYDSIRARAREVLKRLENHNIPIEPFVEGKYTWVQVINEQPYQVFTDDELLVWSLNPSSDILRMGYPVSPLERILDSITMHINLTTHNKLFFLHGRAARSVVVFKSDTLDDTDINLIQQQMSNHINSANASWRLPVLGITPKDDLTVVPLDGGGRDMEFSYLADLNKRMVMAAFHVSPDEIASLSYLSRGTNSQALAESNNEWKLLKSQQSGLRPLLNAITDFINLKLLPCINPEWANLVQVNFEGLDADTPEKEATLISQATMLYYTFNDILDKVEKQRVPIGGDFPLNAAYLQILERYFTMGEILEAFQPDRYKGASQDPKYQFYINNPSWFQFQQLKLQQQQMQQMSAVSQQANAISSAEGQPSRIDQEVASVDDNSQAENAAQDTNEPLRQSNDEFTNELDSAVAQMQMALDSLSKAEKVLPANRKKLLLLHKKAKQKILKDFERQSKALADEILNVLKTGKPPHDHGHED